MEEFVFLSVSGFLCAKDIGKYCIASVTLAKHYEKDIGTLRLGHLSSNQVPLPGISRCLAADVLIGWWRRQRLQNWMDRVACEGVRMHAFPNRFETNYKPWRSNFSQGVVSIPRIYETVRFTPTLYKTTRCPCCQKEPIEAAWYWRDGDKMVRSTPHLDVGCLSCSRFLGCSELREFLEFSSSAVLTVYHRSSVNYMSRLKWVYADVETDSNED